MFTLKRVSGIWYLSGERYTNVHEALSVAFRAR